MSGKVKLGGASKLAGAMAASKSIGWTPMVGTAAYSHNSHEQVFELEDGSRWTFREVRHNLFYAFPVPADAIIVADLPE